MSADERKEPRGLPKRELGETGESVSVLGMGGFHLLEIPRSEVDAILNGYLDGGGNYIETSASYGGGESERKIARAVAGRRDEFLLASKVDERDGEGAMRTLERTLSNLQTDHLDIWFMHAAQSVEDVNLMLDEGGAVAAAMKARDQGKIRFIGVSGHGEPSALLEAVGRFRFDVLMTVVNYYDTFCFPEIEDRLIPLAAQKGTAVIGMKAFGDGYLWRSPEKALRYALSRPVSMVVAGINTPAMLEKDLEIARRTEPMGDGEIEKLLETAIEYRGYVCRQCEECLVKTDIPLKRIFELEGWFDRQMWDGRVYDADDYSMRIRLGPWFDQQDLARLAYRAEDLAIDPEADYTGLNGQCRHGLDIDRKLRTAHGKLTSDWRLY